jgi:predicted nucleic acid-binding protein
MLSLLVSRVNIVPIGFVEQEMRAALAACATQAADFGDALIAACSRSYGVEEVYTFDRKFERAGMVRLEP